MSALWSEMSTRERMTEEHAQYEGFPPRLGNVSNLPIYLLYKVGGPALLGEEYGGAHCC